MSLLLRLVIFAWVLLTALGPWPRAHHCDEQPAMASTMVEDSPSERTGLDAVASSPLVALAVTPGPLPLSCQLAQLPTTALDRLGTVRVLPTDGRRDPALLDRRDAIGFARPSAHLPRMNDEPPEQHRI